MAGAKGLYRFWIMNLSGPDSGGRWNEDARKDVADKLTDLFKRVILHPSCPYSRVDWFDGWSLTWRIDPGEVLVYFVASRETGVAVSRRADPDTNKGGVTFADATGLVSSEVWLTALLFTQ